MTAVAFVSSMRWHGFLGSMRSLAVGTAGRGHATLFVDPPVSPLSLLRQPSRLRDLIGKTDETDDGVRVWHPRVAPGQNARVMQRLNAELLRRGLRKRLDPDLVVVTSLEARGLLRRLDAPSVYVCIDSLDVPGTDTATRYHHEAELVAAADFVAACSLPLVRDFAEQGVDAIYLPHGCDDEFLIEPGSLPLPDELAGRPRPYVGYVGSLNFRVDVDLLRAVADATDGTLVVIGGLLPGAGPSAELGDLFERSNVVAIGHQPGTVLPRYVSALDVGLVPYTDTSFNRRSYPLKIPQYLGAGAAVVSTPNGATEDIPEFVHEARGPADFARAVDLAARTDRAERDAARAAMAERPWTVVADELLAACRGDGVA